MSRSKYRMADLQATRLPSCVCGALRIVTRAVTQVYDDAVRPAGLRITQYSLLSGIDKMGPVSAGALVGALHADQTTLARALKLLREDGLIRRAPDAKKRAKLIELTPRGRRKLNEARKLWAEGQRSVVDMIGEEEWRDVRRRLDRLLGAVAERRNRAA